MPVVDVKFKPTERHPLVESDGVFAVLQTILGRIVAVGLNVPDLPVAHLSSSDVELNFRIANRFDTGKKDLEIVVLANMYPERADDLQSTRVPSMAAGIRGALDLTGFEDLKMSLYVHLGIGGYTEL